jgi:integrase
MLTDVAITTKLAKPTAKRIEHPDGKITGLYLVQQPSGSASWALRYRFAGRPTKLTIGPYPAVGLAIARRRAQEAIGAIAGGKDPARAKTADRAAAKAERESEEDKVERVVALFIDRHAKPKTRDWRETERLLTKEVASRWKGRRLREITKANVNDLLDAIVDRGAPIGANRVFAQLRKMCNWAIGRDLIEKNPCEGVNAPSPETKRKRVLSADEIKLLWEAADALGWPFGPCIKLLILTGQRRDEVAGMRWSELDIEARLWTLPASRSKNKRAHQVPLSDAAMEVLQALPRHEKIDFVFSTTGRTTISGFSRAKASIDSFLAARGWIPATDDDDGAWVLHDIRRTVATNFQKLGVRLEVTEAALNHVSGSRAGIVGVYQQHNWADEKRTALDAWARQVGAVVTGETAASNVVVMSGRA